MQTIYIVEDDESISELTAYALKSAGFKTETFGDSAALFAALEATPSAAPVTHHQTPQTVAAPDLILLDIMLPDEDGLSILKKLKASSKYRDFPVIMLTAKGSELDKIKGLDTGADDYITKPFSVMELTSRIRAVLRRVEKPAAVQFLFAGISLDAEKHTAALNGEPINLTLKEYELLRYLMENPDIALSREKIISTVWEYDCDSESRTIDAHIKSLRQKLGEAGNCIQTVRGVGYKLAE